MAFYDLILVKGDTMFELANVKRLGLLERHAPAMLEKFSALLRAQEFIQGHYPARFEALKVAKLDDYNYEATYLNTTVRFQLMFSYNEHSRPLARVMCLHKYTVADKVHYESLGTFAFDSDGLTDLEENPEYGPRYMERCADEIVVAYLDLAVARYPKKFSQE